MKKKSILTRTTAIAATALMLAWPWPSSAADVPAEAPLTLDKAIHLVRENNPALKAAAEEITAADARITQSRSAYFPQISASAGYTWLDTVSKMNFGSSGELQFMPNDNYDAKVTARATLIDFGKRGANVDLARSGKKSAIQSLELARRDLSYHTVQLFYGILFLRENLRVEEKEIAALNKALDYTTKRYHAGTATPFDISSTEVRLAAARNRALDIEHELRRNELTLRRLTGIAENVPLTLQGSFAVTPRTKLADSELVAQAKELRLEMQLSRESETAAKLHRSLAMKKGLPVVTASLSWGITNGYQPDINEMRNNTAAGLHLEIPLFTGFRTSAEQQESTALLRAATQRRIDNEQQVKTDVEETNHALQTASEKMTTTEVQVQQAELAARHARARYENGMATTLDLLDSEASLSQAELARLQVAYAYVMNNYTLKRATGEIFW
ncbi:MAG: TolC family protein [Chlorobiaceae bacterium]|nr:TolC family protein [Chlorobiaceae bacterium]